MDDDLDDEIDDDFLMADVSESLPFKTLDGSANIAGNAGNTGVVDANNADSSNGVIASSPAPKSPVAPRTGLKRKNSDSNDDSGYSDYDSGSR